MSHKPSRILFPLTIALCLLALALTGVPQSIANKARAIVFDASLPGHRLLAVARTKIIAARERHSPDAEHDRRMRDLELQARGWQQRYRQLQAQNGLLNEKLTAAVRDGVSPYRGSPAEPLVVPQLLQASVLGDESAAMWRSGTLIDRGSADGLRESTLVLEEVAALVDQGVSAGLSAGQPIYSGRNVVGKIGVVGRWTSTIQPLTDPKFRGMAQLARKTPNGITFASTAILEGTGEDFCRLTLVPATEAVSVGDEVYTNHDDSTLPFPFFYGTVIQADLKPGASHWEIRVEPAVKQIDSHTVQILTRSLNPARQLAN
jgi:cell shape-determining protein MreC